MPKCACGCGLERPPGTNSYTGKPVRFLDGHASWREPKAVLLEVSEAAYFAGLFDGEGSITVGRRRNNRFVDASVYNTHVAVLHDLKRAFAGSIQIDSRAGKQSRFASGKIAVSRRDCFKWHASHTKGLSFLLTIRPFLRIRRAEVDFLLDLNLRAPGAFDDLRERLARVRRPK